MPGADAGASAGAGAGAGAVSTTPVRDARLPPNVGVTTAPPVLYNARARTAVQTMRDKLASLRNKLAGVEVHILAGLDKHHTQVCIFCITPDCRIVP